MELINAETINWYLVNQEPFIRRRFKIAQLLAAMMYPWVLGKNRADAWEWWQQPIGEMLSKYLPYLVSEFIRIQWNKDFAYWKAPRGAKKEITCYAKLWATTWDTAKALEDEAGINVVTQFAALYGESLAAGGLLLPVIAHFPKGGSGKALFRKMQTDNRILQKLNDSPFPELPLTTEFLQVCYRRSEKADNFKKNFFGRVIKTRMELAACLKLEGTVCISEKGVDGRAIYQLRKKGLL